jgi:MoaA/NifB/PqqE/SkfB family radical SAM enzyme
MGARMTNDGRHRAITGRKDGEAGRISHMIEHMAANKAYIHARDAAGGDPDGALLEAFRERFRWYRESWRAQPKRMVAEKLTGAAFKATGLPPLCVDVETAAVCDLACPFCFRQFVATPDKLIDEALFHRIIDQMADLGVPSLKLNWRGEPLLHPRLPALVDYAKKKGILETIINTNATTLDEKKARALIEAGLDMVIYSFDGGSKASYERMRPGRFKPNGFDEVYRNIRRFAEIRTELGAAFPRTKIQMILTQETFAEQESFYALFDDCVDDVTVKQYTERGGSLADLDDATRTRIEAGLAAKNLPSDGAYLREADGSIFVAVGRLPCEQPFQRLLVSYDGRVAMCCYDWGAQHPVGYVDALAISLGDQEYKAVQQKAATGNKGFERMPDLALPKLHNHPEPVVRSLGEIWTGADIDHARRCHIEGRGGDLEVCRDCQFKETYRWEKVES